MDKMKQPVSIAECSRLTGINKWWLGKQVKGLNPPPLYLEDGKKRVKVIPEEVAEWYRKSQRVSQS